MKAHRKHYKVDSLGMLTEEEMLRLRNDGVLAPRLVEMEEYHVQVPESEANLVSSRVDIEGVENIHAPVLDIDLAAELVPSSTPGHFHLYIDKLMTWEKYEKLLYALRDCGVISKGYVGASIARGATFVRKKGVKKNKNDKNS